jgi:hypothetical protein
MPDEGPVLETEVWSLIKFLRESKLMKSAEIVRRMWNEIQTHRHGAKYTRFRQ